MADYEHLSDVIDDIERQIKIEYDGKEYDELTNEEKEKVCLDKFIYGNTKIPYPTKNKYRDSAKRMRMGIDAYRGGEIEGTGNKVIKISNRGKTHYQIRQKNGRFGKWIR